MAVKKLAKPVWLHILEAAREFNGKPFTPTEIYNKIFEKAPRVKLETIRGNIYGMTPNHPSSKYYPTILKSHAVFTYLENGQFQMLSKDELLRQIIKDVNDVLKTNRSCAAKLNVICRLLNYKVDYYNWVGFYAVDKQKADDLVLVSFAGEPTEHIRIPFGKGICGQAASQQKIFVVQDVSKEHNYLSCSSKVKSEIVIPIFENNSLVGELDVDSHIASSFTLQDEEHLTIIAKMASELLQRRRMNL